jgi:hypothetical protein
MGIDSELVAGDFERGQGHFICKLTHSCTFIMKRFANNTTINLDKTQEFAIQTVRRLTLVAAPCFISVGSFLTSKSTSRPAWASLNSKPGIKSVR